MPFMLMAIAAIGAFGPSMMSVVIVLALGIWPGYARMVRGEVLSVKQSEFIEAARVAGCRPVRLILLHILPNVLNTIVVMATLNFGMMIIFEGGLSFLGIGSSTAHPFLGRNAGGRTRLCDRSLAPRGLSGPCHHAGCSGDERGFGDWLRDVLDPKRKVSLLRS